jgi:hypothetical protein
VIGKEVLVAVVRPDEVALSVYVPAALILQLLKDATPFVAVNGLVLQLRVPPLPVLIARVMEALELVTVLPPLSSTVTTGCMAQECC